MYDQRSQEKNPYWDDQGFTSSSSMSMNPSYNAYENETQHPPPPSAKWYQKQDAYIAPSRRVLSPFHTQTSSFSSQSPSKVGSGSKRPTFTSFNTAPAKPSSAAAAAAASSSTRQSSRIGIPTRVATTRQRNDWENFDWRKGPMRQDDDFNKSVPLPSKTKPSNRFLPTKREEKKQEAISFTDYQEKYIEYITQPSIVRFAAYWDMGLGKSLLATGVSQCIMARAANIEKIRVKTVVIAGLTLLENFRKSLIKYGRDLRHIERHYDFWTYARCSQSPRELIDACKNNIVIVDEVHFIRASVTFEKANRVVKNRIPIRLRGFNVDKGKQAASIMRAVRGARNVLLLTGTPTPNRPSEILNSGYILTDHPKEFFEAFILSKKNAKILDSGGLLSEADQQLLDDTFSGRIGILSRSDLKDNPILKKIPARTEINVLIEMNEEYAQQYRAVEQSEETQLGGETIKQTGAFYSGLRRVANVFYASLERHSSQKRDFALQIVTEQKKLGRRGSITSSWLERGVDFLMRRFVKAHVKCRSVTGKHTERQRAAAINDFNTAKIDTILLSSAGSTGVDLLGAAYSINFDSVWNQATRDQANDRGVRVNSHANENFAHVYIYNLLMAKPGKEFDYYTRRMKEAIRNQEPGAPNDVWPISSSSKSNKDGEADSLIHDLNQLNIDEKDDGPPTGERVAIDLYLWDMQMKKSQRIKIFEKEYLRYWSI
jgi:superfamily II DNA or RNA helicase